MDKNIIKQNYIIFGCGGFLTRRLEEIEKVINIVCVCDNNQDMWGKKWSNKYLCISPEDLSKYKHMEVLISVENEDAYNSIKNQLYDKNISCRHVNEVLSEAWINNKMPIDDYLKEMMDSTLPRIILLGAPAHSNLGDQAQTYCIQSLIEESFKERKLFIFEGNPLRKNYYYLLYLIKNIITSKDKVLVHSGYHCTDLFQKEENLNEKIVQLFPENKLIFLPQTIYFKSQRALKKSMEVYNSHRDLTIMCRDRVSYGLAKTYYNKCKLVLFPDFVTSLIGRRNYNEERKGILLCLRGMENEESNMTEEKKELLLQELCKLDEVTVTDTNSQLFWQVIREKRKEVIEKELEYYSRFKLIITDRYHGMIFSLIANTPVIVIPSTDHKLSSGVQWFPHNMFPDIFQADNCDEIYKIAEQIIDADNPNINPPYFYNKYFSNLVEIL